MATAGIEETVEEQDSPLEGDEVLTYRSLAARANYLSMDRPDIMFACKELCRRTSNPTQQSWRQLVRLAKYLKSHPRVVWHYPWQENMKELTMYSDANWAGCQATRRSTSGGVATLGMHPIRMYSKTQNLVALSSAESEFYGTLKAATESLGVLALLEDLGQMCKTVMQVDASAALGVIQRRGVGKIRPLQTGALWIQEQKLRDVIAFSKTPGSDNTADLFPKNVSRQVCESHMERLGCTFNDGRAAAAAQLHQVNRHISHIKSVHDELFPSNGAIFTECIHMFDWSKCENHNVDSMIQYVEKMKDDRITDVKQAWAKQSVTDVMDKVSGFKFARCSSVRGDLDKWKDHWGHDKHQTSCQGRIMRHHTQARKSLFTCAKVAHGPKDLNKLLPVRVTIGQFTNGERFCHVDDWCDEATAHAELKDQWTGTTIFHERPDVEPTCPEVRGSQCPGNLVRLHRDCKV